MMRRKGLIVVVALAAVVAGCSTVTRTGALASSAACWVAPPSCAIVIPTAAAVVYVDEHGQDYRQLRWNAYVRQRGGTLSWDKRDIRALAKIWGNSEDAYAAYLRTRYGERPPNSVSAEDAEVGVALAVLCGGGSRR